MGHAEDDLDVYHPLVRRGGAEGFDTVYDGLETPGLDQWERLEDVAVSAAGRVLVSSGRYTADFSAPTGWTLLEGPSHDPAGLATADAFALAEGAPAVAWTVAWHPTAGAFAGGEAVDADGLGHDVLRAGPPGALAPSHDDPAEAGTLGGVWEIEVDRDGVVWALACGGEADLFPAWVEVWRAACH